MARTRRRATVKRRARRVHTCNGKRRFRDQNEATQALHFFSSKGSRERIPVRAYECDQCRGWHLTSQAMR